MAGFELEKIVTFPTSFMGYFPEGVDVVEIRPQTLATGNESISAMMDHIIGYVFPPLIETLKQRGLNSVKTGITRAVVSREKGCNFVTVNLHLKDLSENTHFVWFYPKIEDVELKTGRGYGAGVLKICDEWGG